MTSCDDDDDDHKQLVETFVRLTLYIILLLNKKAHEFFLKNDALFLLIKTYHGPSESDTEVGWIGLSLPRILLIDVIFVPVTLTLTNMRPH